MDWATLECLLDGLHSGDPVRIASSDAQLLRIQADRSAAADALGLVQRHGHECRTESQGRILFYILGVWQKAAKECRWRSSFNEQSNTVRNTLATLMGDTNAPHFLRNKAADVLSCAAVMSEWPEIWGDHISWANSLASSLDPSSARFGAKILQGTCEEVTLNAASVGQRRYTELQTLLKDAAPTCMATALRIPSDAGIDVAAAFLHFADPTHLAAPELGLLEVLQRCDHPMALLPICHEVVEVRAVPPGGPWSVLFDSCLLVVVKAAADPGCDDASILRVVLTLVERHLIRLIEAAQNFTNIMRAVHDRMLASYDDDVLELCVSIWDVLADLASTRADQGSSLRDSPESSDPIVTSLRPMLFAFLSAVLPGEGRCIPKDVVSVDTDAESWYSGLSGRYVLTASRICGVYCVSSMIAKGSIMRVSLDRLKGSEDVKERDVMMQVIASVSPDLLGMGEVAHDFVVEVLAHHAVTVIGREGMGDVSLLCHTFGVISALCSIVKKMPDVVQADLIGLLCGVALAVSTSDDTNIIKYAGQMLSDYASRSLLPILAATESFFSIIEGLEKGAVGAQFSGYYVAVCKVMAAYPSCTERFAGVIAHIMTGPEGVAILAAAVEGITAETDCDAARRQGVWRALQPHMNGIGGALQKALQSEDNRSVSGIVSLLRCLFRWMHREVGQELEAQVVSVLSNSAQGQLSEETLVSLFELLELLVRPAKSPHVKDTCLLICRMLPSSEQFPAAANEAFVRLICSVIEYHPEESIIQPPAEVAAFPSLVTAALRPLYAEATQPSELFFFLTWMAQMEKAIQLFSTLCSMQERQQIALRIATLRLRSELHSEKLTATLLMVSGGLTTTPDAQLACQAVEVALQGRGDVTEQMLALTTELRQTSSSSTTQWNSALGALQAALSSES